MERSPMFVDWQNMLTAILLKTIYNFEETPLKIPMTFFTEIDKILKYLWK
jgi:hypothetical protein